jgi:hypothetical protein
MYGRLAVRRLAWSGHCARRGGGGTAGFKMSWLLFLDESGHDHKQMPYEVRGGVALHAGEVWPFVQDVQRLELDCFATGLREFQKELKGCKLVDRDRYR